jgi:deoxyribose-phosphate aldolase
MNIEQITREVVQELMGEMLLAQGPHHPGVPYKRILILFNRSDLAMAPILEELSAWSSKAQLTLVAPRWARSLWSNPSLPIEYVSFDRAESAKAYVGSHDRVVIMGASQPLFQKLKRMDRQHLPSALAVEALHQNKPVMLLESHWQGIDTTKLEAMGIRLGSLQEIARIFPLPPTPALPPASPAQVSQAPGANATGASAAGITRERIRQVMQMGAQRMGLGADMTIQSGDLPKDLARMIDHTLLKAEATEDQVKTLCEEARANHFASVCINPSYVPLAASLLKGSDVMVCTVIGFPLGATDSQTKADETRHAVASGADEIDMVINVGALKSQNAAKVEADIRAVVQAAQGKTVKVILETALLNDAEKVLACQLSEKAGAHFVKTSTGFGPSGATEADVSLMRRTVRRDMEVKASGGIRDQETALKMIRAGATRIGASASVAIAHGDAPAKSGGDKY